ncbi:glycosyltransferase family 2 protein [Rhodococcus pseudokoreensis]|uniref:Glycosyltransferase family 2 protein n=1 Tax=Rhodococcus pseudokoreensis TaxID=2811421 RepID=A0A974W4C1_9NOCA|nr:glycosyltransferase family 2 protein [Rhodococcus pseudokoreensis]QSE91078.1 glycosyltransferase family 2 protein [Rhodococcus pseudokoreensis]
MSERAPISAGDVTVVIPCMNEAGSLPGVLAAVPRDYRTVVVDNNSTDDTAAVAAAHGASVVREPVPGYGSAVHAGVLAAQTRVVCVLDGDGSMDPSELPMLVAALNSGADLAVGRRRGKWLLHSRIGNAVLAARLRRRYGLPIHDLGAMRAVRRQDLLDLGVDDRRSGYPLQLLVLAGRAHWRVVEQDITYRPRTAGTSKVSGSLKGTVVAVHDFWKVIG